jgi:hypothetical protein
MLVAMAGETEIDQHTRVQVVEEGGQSVRVTFTNSDRGREPVVLNGLLIDVWRLVIEADRQLSRLASASRR